MVRNPIIVMIITLAVVSRAHAARLTEIQGTVLVNKGDGFWEVNGSTSVSAGDRVLVRGKGRAKIDYGNGCIKRVLASQTAVVAAKPSCDAPPSVAQQQGVSKTPVAMKDGQVAPASIQSDSDPALALVGAAAVATTAAGIASQDENHHDGVRKSEGDEGNVVGDDATAHSADANPSASANREVHASSFLVVDNLVITKSDAASVALEGADNKDGSPASP